jgi:hypothetical protein
MNQLSFRVSGSSDEPYTVDFLQTEKGLAVVCSCQAATNNMLCKHRVAFLKGSPENLIDPDPEAIQTAISWIAESPLLAQFHSLLQAEAEAEEAKKKLATAKKAFARKLTYP